MKIETVVRNNGMQQIPLLTKNVPYFLENNYPLITRAKYLFVWNIFSYNIPNTFCKQFDLTLIRGKYHIDFFHNSLIKNKVMRKEEAIKFLKYFLKE